LLVSSGLHKVVAIEQNRQPDDGRAQAAFWWVSAGLAQQRSCFVRLCVKSAHSVTSGQFSEEFPLDRFRSLLGVETGKLREFKHLKYRAIDPAVLEVNGLGEFGCTVEPVFKGRKVIAIRLSWWAKTLEQKKVAFRELRVSRVGRRARLLGTVETVAINPPPRPLPSPVQLPPRGHSRLKDWQYKNLCAKFPGIDIHEMEKQFVEWNESKGGETLENYVGAFSGFIKQKVEREG
jgi:hypothetical protein